MPAAVVRQVNKKQERTLVMHWVEVGIQNDGQCLNEHRRHQGSEKAW